MQALTTREYQVARLVAAGHSNQEIGDRLRISVQTVKNHLRSVFRKLALDNRVELALYIALRRKSRMSRASKSRTRAVHSRIRRLES
jgi:DNA-binding CsgD family transcriptional regulator